MAATLPPTPAYDQARAGQLRIAAPILADLLRLPKTQRLEKVDFDPVSNALVLTIAGEPMPSRPQQGDPKEVVLVISTQADGSTHLRWDHAGDPWLLRGADPP